MPPCFMFTGISLRTMETVRLALHAMATRFELVLHGENAVYLRAAGEEALQEIRRLEAQLSFYRPTSDVSTINAHAANYPVTVEPRLFELLSTAKKIHDQTAGAFDITIGPLMRCWGFVNNTAYVPPPDALDAARSLTGMHLVHLDDVHRTVSFERPGVQIDLGGIGKGYAIDEAIASLVENGVTSALLHGGTSTMYALGHPPNAPAWNAALPSPISTGDHPDAEHVLAVVPLSNASLSSSAPSGKSFFVNGQEYGHVIDPRSGYPVNGAALTAVVASSAMKSDALSTALLVKGVEAVEPMAKTFNLHALAASLPDNHGQFQVSQHGIPLYHQDCSLVIQGASNMDLYTHSTL